MWKTHSHELKLDKLYFYTKHNGFYEKFGWEFINEFEAYIGSNDVQIINC